MDRERILERLRALAAKTVENGCTEAEALAAAEMLGRMMDRHGFDQMDLVTTEKAPITMDTYFAPGRKLGNLVYVCCAVAEFCDCKVWCTRAKEGAPFSATVYFGHETDALMATYLTHTFAAAMAIAWSDHAGMRGAVIDPATGKPKMVATPKERDAFERGMMARLSSRLRAMKAARSATVDDKTGRTGQSLVVVKNSAVEDAYKALSLKLRTRPSRRKQFEAEAYHAGARAADQVNITTGIGARASARIA